MTAAQRRGYTNESDRQGRDRRGASDTDDHRLAQNLPDGGRPVAEREYEDYILAERDSDSDEPDVLLDVPVVKVDEINLDVEQLRARVSLQAEVLDLLRLNVGADVFIGQVGLEIKGVEAQALLKVRLDNVARIVDRVLTTIDRNPQILEQITEGVGSAVEQVGAGGGKAVGELGAGAGSAVEEVGAGAGSAIEEVGAGAGSAVEEVGAAAGTAVEEVGAGAGSAVEDVGSGAAEAVEDTDQTAKRTAQGAGRAAGGPGKTAKQKKATAQKARERGAAKRRTRTGDGEGTKRSAS